MKKLTVISIIMVLVFVLTACAPQAAPAGAPVAKEKIKIGMANFSQCCAYFIGMNDAVKAAAAAYPNVEIISTDANGDAAKLNSEYRRPHCKEGRWDHHQRRLARATSRGHGFHQ